MPSLTNETVILEIPAIKVAQWLSSWNSIKFDSKRQLSRPPQQFFVFSIPATQLKALSGVYHRAAEEGDRSGIQRQHDTKRSSEIQRYLTDGYPWSTLTDAQRQSEEFNDLRKPGWLATSILVNILQPTDERRGLKVDANDIVTVVDPTTTKPTIKLPPTFTGPLWRPKSLPPIEVIDGQHRLWAFEDVDLKDRYEVPVVAFHGLDVSWQAYLFWTVNINPKKIGPSLAFDLYPLLRSEEWLNHSEGAQIYRETRAQELTEILWSHPWSPWHQRINMLGQKGVKGVTQAAWVRALTNTFVKSFEGPRIRLGGLFGAPVGQVMSVLQWSRAQQAAFLIYVWMAMRQSINECQASWALSLRGQKIKHSGVSDPALSGDHTLLNTDQGIRGVLHVVNDMCYVNARTLRLQEWIDENVDDFSDMSLVHETITRLIGTVDKQPVGPFLKRLTSVLAAYDWRTASAPGLNVEEKTAKSAFRGSGGYRELRAQLLRLLAGADGNIGSTATKIIGLLRIDAP